MIDETFIEELSSSCPTPGGGGASAYCGAIAAALASMVGNLTLGKAKFQDIEAEVIGSLGRLAVLKSRLVDLIDEDTLAFSPLAEAYKMPKDTPDQLERRNDAIQRGLIEACEPPVKMMRSIIDVLHECDFLARNGSRMAISDAGACALLSKAALMSASLNVYINASSMDDPVCSAKVRDEADALMSKGIGMADEIYSYVAEKIDAYKVG